MSLSQLKSGVDYAACNAQKSVQNMQCEQGVMHVNAINMQANKEYVDAIGDPAYALNWINYLWCQPQFALTQDDSIIFSPQVKDCCRSLCCLKYDIINLDGHIEKYKFRNKPCSLLTDKSDCMKWHYEARLHSLAHIIQQNMQNHIQDMNKTIEHQMNIDSQTRLNYQVAVDRYQRYDLVAWYQNQARLKKAAMMIQLQVRRQSAQHAVEVMRKNKGKEQVIVDQIAQC